MKTAILAFMLGLIQGMILLDWLRDKQALHVATKRKK